ncbi:MAG: ABC transporter ATP-binding protein [Actinomycetota bacterium]
MSVQVDEPESALTVTELVKDYPRAPRGWRSFFLPSWKQGSVRALDGVSFGVRRGSICGLLGTNGAGKTTLIKICYSLLLPTSGAVRVLGEDPLHRGREIRRRMGMVMSEERSFYWRLSGRRNLEFFAALHDLDRAAADRRIEELGELTGIREYLDVPFSDYSTGMRQKAAVARALLHDPEVLLMDEPTRSLSPDAAYPLQDFVRSELVGAMGKTVLLATQDMDEAERLCDDVALLHRGRLLYLGTLAGLMELAGRELGEGAGLGDVFVELVRRDDAAEGGVRP